MKIQKTRYERERCVSSNTSEPIKQSAQHIDSTLSMHCRCKGLSERGHIGLFCSLPLQIKISVPQLKFLMLSTGPHRLYGVFLDPAKGLQPKIKLKSATVLLINRPHTSALAAESLVLMDRSMFRRHPRAMVAHQQAPSMPSYAKKM